MDLKKLTAFVDLAASLNYTATAAHLFTTQATISKQILALEKELDVTLFDRHHRQVQLTKAGQVCLPWAQKMVTAQQQMQAALAQEKQVQCLTIRGIPSMAHYPAFQWLSQFHKAYPNIQLHFSEAESYELLPSLQTKASDIVFMRLFPDNRVPGDKLITATDHFVVVLPKHHPLADANQLTIAEIAQQELLILNQTTNLYQPIWQRLIAVNPHPHIVYEGQRIDLMLQLVQQGLGIAITMAQTLTAESRATLEVIPLSDAPVSQLAFIRRHPAPPQTQAFWSFCQQQLAHATLE
ncbi:LysR family transcriptional regulator [Loigolactobacillus bifermentans]|uniref:Transcription regulator n=1 Tax=Loigolactobacillus bifermentans DSM 20003 TaxID=1423726 RepID=A0A0R1H2W3_9LACO|nr:LysR family transcriptional regulator [Loigolactobacillus bifermentans]KRK40552.1 transcription regulator [Loigolactobacillus bifermentans DSM 20003]QGG59755.1 LysR family transcriptional regulator [Loigolactobacillus bifermentans]